MTCDMRCWLAFLLAVFAVAEPSCAGNTIGSVLDTSDLVLTIHTEPVKGEKGTFRVTLDVRTKEDWSSVGIKISLPKDLKVVDGALAWSGKLSSGESAKAVVKVTVPGPGIYRVQGNGSVSRPTSTVSRGWNGSVHRVIVSGNAQPAPAVVVPEKPPYNEQTKLVAATKIQAADINRLLAGNPVVVQLGTQKVELRALLVDTFLPRKSTEPDSELTPNFGLRMRVAGKEAVAVCSDAGESMIPLQIAEHTGEDGWYRSTSVAVVRYAWQADILEFEWIELGLLKYEEPPTHNVPF